MSIPARSGDLTACLVERSYS